MKEFYRVAKIFKESYECTHWTDNLTRVIVENLNPTLYNQPLKYAYIGDKIQLQRILIDDGINPENAIQPPTILQEFTLGREIMEKWEKTR